MPTVSPSAGEAYYCNFGLDPDHLPALKAAGLEVSGVNQDDEVRIVELPGHPFFVGTLFVPQVASRPDVPLQSEQVIVSAPMSFTGSAQRIWRLTGSATGWAKAALGTLAVVLIAFAWMLVLVWYCIWGLLLVPYRLLRRGSRKRKVTAMQHREVLEAVHRSSPAGGWKPQH